MSSSFTFIPHFISRKDLPRKSLISDSSHLYFLTPDFRSSWAWRPQLHLCDRCCQWCGEQWSMTQALLVLYTYEVCAQSPTPMWTASSVLGKSGKVLLSVWAASYPEILILNLTTWGSPLSSCLFHFYKWMFFCHKWAFIQSIRPERAAPAP